MKLNNLFYVFSSYSTSNAPKTMELHFPRTSRSSHLPSILLSIAATYFWLVVAFKTINRQPFKAAVYYIFVSLLLFNLTPQTMGRCPPTRSLPSAPPLYHPPTASTDYWVDCWLLSSIGGHLRPRPRLPLYFLMRLALALKLTEPAMARAHWTPRACFRPIGSSGAISWWCRWPTHGGREPKPLVGGAVLLMLVVVCCCVFCVLDCSRVA